MDLKTFVITWMDGEIATYENVTASVLNGELHVQQYTSAGNLIRGADWHFPLSNIRARGPRPWAHNHAHPDTELTYGGPRGS